METALSLLPTTQAPTYTQAAEEIAAEAGAPYLPPARPCYICRQYAWRWNAETQEYECAGNLDFHIEYIRWHVEKWGREPGQK